MFNPMTAHTAATQSLRQACRHAAEHGARERSHAAPAPAPAVPRAGRRAATGMVFGGWLLALLQRHPAGTPQA